VQVITVDTGFLFEFRTDILAKESIFLAAAKADAAAAAFLAACN